MFLKSMELFGFKSFADRTKIEFEQGITVIVGPNGCGKSNIVDSVKWVLGEKQAKNIRGEKMEDVIFSGTESRKFLSIAEVSLAFNNETRFLGFDSDVVTVTRRVLRDGESEYLINKSPVRLKDIEQLFMDTGIGKSSYSVMEQGRIDMILSSRAEDRRYIFEEAAGVSRFKLQKKESLKKLIETGENLERINDIIHEIEREKDLKAKQAEKTKVYLSLKDEMKKNDIKLVALKNKDLVKRREKLSESLAKLNTERDELSAKISSVSTENETDEKYKNDIQLQLFELDKKLHTYKIKVEDIDQKTEKNKKLIKEQEERSQMLISELSERDSSKLKLIEEKEKSLKTGEEINKKIDEDKVQLKNCFDNRKRKIEFINESRDNIERNKSDIKSLEADLLRLREDLEVVIKQLIDAIDKRKAELMNSEEERQNVRGDIHFKLSAISNKLNEAKEFLRSGVSGEALSLIESINVEDLASKISMFESYEDGFRTILFDKTGIHAQKENIDSRIREKTASIENKRAENQNLENAITEAQRELESINEMITRIEKDLSRNDSERSWIEKHIESLDRQILDIVRHIESIKTEISKSEKHIAELNAEIEDWKIRLVEFNERTQSLHGKIEENKVKKDEIENRIKGRKESTIVDMDNLNKINQRIGECDKNVVEFDYKLSSLEEYLWIEYEKKLSDLANIKVDEFEISTLNEEIQKIKKKISDLGPINNLAIEEFADLKKRFEYYIEQKQDIEKARQDIMSVIEEINNTSINMFLDTFEQIRKNFSQIFQQLFEGGQADVALTDPEKILDSGIDITVRPPGKKPKSITLLSGGERSLTAIALLFATYMVKPSPFCFLDEIDAALDESNVERFLRMMKQFSQKTQFIMISHNKKSMSVGSSLYGITMEEPGVSRVISVKLDRK
ncbi:MAG: AAA family ATPase [Spirochaetes bacterium]|nr:AAA family ATPase [Spirochaetota bacterium]